MEVLKMTQVLQALYKEFKEEGREEGREKGREKGRVEGEINVICKFLKTKFGLSSLSLQKKAQKLIDIDLIDGITEKLFITSSLEEAGGIIEEALKIQKEIKSLD